MASNWTGTYTWRVEKWTRLTEEEVYSPEFEIGGYTWRLLVYPRGDDCWLGSGYIAVFLEFQEASFTLPQLCPKVKFELLAVRDASHGDSRRLEATHIFSTLEDAWGFPQFIPRQEALTPRNGYLVNNTLTLRVNIRMEIDGILGMTSKAETGFMGLKSHSQTSLLSSFLLCLYHIKIFRKAVYEVSTLDSDDPQESLLLALQHLFYKLKYQNTGVETTDLVNALSWDCTDLRLQHDVLEMQRTLFEKLSEEDQTGSLNNCMSELFMGEYSIRNESPNVPEGPMRKQSYLGITLDILECRDIYASLEKFCQIDSLEEDNNRRKISQGLVQSKRYTLFDSFPTVLQFNLKRCYCSPNSNAFIKINSHYEFYDDLDMDFNDRVLLSKNADRAIENKYRLYSVIVHADGTDGGRYLTYIRYQKKWYRFGQEVVKAVTKETAISEQFGDQNGTVSANFSEGYKRVRKSAAVTLVYVRKSEWKRVMCNGGEENIPEQIKDRFDNERVAKEEQQKKKDAHLYVHIKLAMESHFSEQIGKSHYFDLVDFDKVKNYRVCKKTPFEEFKEKVSKDFGIPKHLQRFWTWRLRPNNTIRVCKPLIEAEQVLKVVLDLRHSDEMKPPPDKETTALMTIRLFLETPDGYRPGVDGVLHAIQQDKLLIFIKYYDPDLLTLSYLGHMSIEKTGPFHVIFERAKKMAGLAPEEHVIGFEEVKYSPIVVCGELEPNSTPEQELTSHGDIIIIQKVATLISCALPTVKSFLDFVQ